jgi:beta-galactosidase GanA
MKPARYLTLFILLAASTTLGAAELPYLRKQGTATQLIVDSQPFLMRGGELDNSSGEPAYLRRSWPKLKALNMNALVAPVYWNVIEPTEGKYDFATVDGLIADARANEMHLVLLWFGSWKNSMSCYTPDWVKQDVARFPRSLSAAGTTMEILSPFGVSNRDADARVFAALMKHLRETDNNRTVVMIQVENEVGMIPDARDHSPEANRLFTGPVPAALMDYLAKHTAELAPELRATWQAAGMKSKGTWEEVFGTSAAAEEVFMAWHFALYTHAVAAAGKAEHRLPMYTNAALIRPGYQPGQYPSAGPLPHLIDIWRAAAPALDFIAPDIYFAGKFAEWTKLYTRSSNPLFIPETLRSPDAAVNVLYALGAHDAICFSPYAIEAISEPAEGLLTKSYDLVAQLTPLLASVQGKGMTAGFLQESIESKQPQQVRLGGWTIFATFERTTGTALADGISIAVGTENTMMSVTGGVSRPVVMLPAGGLAIATGQDEFIFAGTGLVLTFATGEASLQTGILSVEEGRFVDGKWEHIRWLNGDQTHQGRHVRLESGRFTIQRVKLYRYR